MWGIHTGATYSRSCHSDEDIVVAELVRLGCGALLGITALVALEDSEGRHSILRSRLCCELELGEWKRSW